MKNYLKEPILHTIGVFIAAIIGIMEHTVIVVTLTLYRPNWELDFWYAWLKLRDKIKEK